MLRQYGVFVEHRVELGDALRQHDGFSGREAAVYLDTQVNFVACRLAVHSHSVYRVCHLV